MVMTSAGHGSIRFTMESYGPCYHFGWTVADLPSPTDLPSRRPDL